MISEALELHVKVGRVSHCWCMCVVIHGCGWFGEARMKVVDDMHANKAWNVGRMFENAGAFSECEAIY